MKTILSITLLSFFLASCGSSNNEKAVSDTTTVDTAHSDSSAEKPAEKKENWNYSEEEDKMTSKKNYFASVDANELLNFEFPYNGGSTATLWVRKVNGKGDIVLAISKGQFITKYDGTSFKVRFDDKPAKSFQVSGASDGSSDVVFFNYNSMIDKIKSSKRVIIQAEFYQEGLRAIEFNTEGLRWNR